MMSWTEQDILFNYSPYTSCKEIFQAVCDEIGNYYTERGYKYARSRPKVKVENKNMRLEVCFWSSGANTPGDYVCLDILSYFYSKKLKGYIAIPNKFYNKNKITQVKKIYGEVFERDPQNDDPENPLLIESTNCNVYGLDEEKFYKIIDYINNKISLFTKLQTTEGVIEYLTYLNERRVYSLPSLEDHIQLTFPDIDIKKYLRKK